MPKRTRKSPPTMREVAKLANVSQTTVSFIINDVEHVSIPDETRQRVWDAIQELGYRPNMTARSLRTQRSMIIAIMIADISNALYHNIVRTVQNVARVHNYDVLIANTDHKYENEKQFCEAVIRRPIDGVILVPFHLSTQELDNFVKRTGHPVVALGQHIEHPEIDIVFADDEIATRNAILWLLNQKDHQRVGFIGVPDSFPPGPRRYRGYERALREAGFPIDPDLIQNGDFTPGSGYRAMQSLLKLPNRPTAVFAVNDLMAIGAMGAAHDLGYSIPDDVAIMGFDNIPECTLVRPRLTTVAQAPHEIGKCLIEALLSRIEGNAPAARQRFETKCEIVEREST